MKKALIVDDDPNISELLRLYFDKDGFAVITCLDGEKAVETFNQANPDVVILDLMLPGRDGYDIMRDIRRSSDVPILMLTARGDTLDKVVRAYAGQDLAGCIFTKVDEAASLAPALDVAVRHGLEIRYLTNGQRVPEDLHLPNRAYLLHRALREQGAESPWHLNDDEAGMMLAAASGGA